MLGELLGPMAEQNLRLAMLLSQDDVGALFTRSISQVIIALQLLVVFSQVWKMLWKGRQS